MRARERRAAVIAAAEEGIKRWLLEEQHSGGLLLGGIVMTSPTKLKVRVVDAKYQPSTYVLTLEEMPS